MFCVITRIRQGEKQIQFLIKKRYRVTVKANLQVKEKKHEGNICYSESFKCVQMSDDSVLET